jgi:hypothetical protein
VRDDPGAVTSRRPSGRAATLWERLQPRRGRASRPGLVAADGYEAKSGNCSHKDTKIQKKKKIALTKTQRHKEQQIIEAVGPISAQVIYSTDIRHAAVGGLPHKTGRDD